MTGLTAYLVVDAATAAQAEVVVHSTSAGLALGAVRVAGLTIQSADRHSPYDRPAGGPDVLADLFDQLAAQLREQHAIWLTTNPQEQNL